MAEIFSNPDGSVVTREKAHAQDNPARALGIIGTVLSGLGILGLGIGSRGRNNWNNGNWNNGNYGGYYGGSDISCQAAAMTSQDLYIERQQAQNYIDTTKQYYEGKLSGQRELTNAFFDSYKRDVDNSFNLYKYTRDHDDALMNRINEVDKKVDIMAAIRPYQDALIDNKINTNAIIADYALSKRTCKMIEGQLVLPSEPVVTGYGSFPTCHCCTAPATV